MSPNVEVYAQLPRPDGVREGCMPYAAWKCVPGMHNSSNGIELIWLTNHTLEIKVLEI